MQDLIFVSQRIPYPPTKGDKVRSWNLLRRLASAYRIHLACFIDDRDDWQHEPALRDLCEAALLLPLRPPVAKMRGLRALWSGEALTRAYFHHPEMAVWLNDRAARLTSPKIFVFSSGVAGYVMTPQWRKYRRIIDMVDVDSDKWRQYAERRRGVARWLYGREARKLLEFEREVALSFDATLFVSDSEAELFRSLSPETAEKTIAVRNGVDEAFFDPALRHDNPYPAETAPIVFTGAMDYWPNVDAVSWFAREVLPTVRQKAPAARFYIAGANPTRQVTALQEMPGIEVTGRVADIRPYIAHARVVVAPLRVARGVQNKVLEGMAMGRPVVASSMALEGIAAVPDQEVIIADEADDFAARTCAALNGVDVELGCRARRRVIADHSWDASFVQLQQLLDA